MKRLFFLLILLLVCSISYSSIITGQLFNGDTFEKLNKTLVTVEDPNGNVVSQQLFNENYEVEVPTSGSYLIRAYFYKDGKLEYYTENKFQATQDKMQLDLVLIPYELYQLIPEPGDAPPLVNSSSLVPPGNNSKPGLDINIILMVVLALLLLVILYTYISSNKNKHSESSPNELHPEHIERSNENTERPKEEKAEDALVLEVEKEENPYDLDEDGKKVLKILSEQEDRIMQKELREILNFSETKMSLLLAELEVHGYVKRIKKGRDNIVKLTKST